MENVQALFDRSGGAVISLPPGEHQGPLRVTRSCTVEGAAATLWAASGPVLLIEAPQVTVRGLRVEVIGRGTDRRAQTAIEVKARDCRLEGVEAAGLVTGQPGEAEDWCLPRLVDLGVFAAGEDNSFLLELWVPQEAAVENLMNGVTISPTVLQAGMNRLCLKTGEISDNTILYGELLLKTAQVARRLYVKGEAAAGAALQREAKPRSMEPRQVIPGNAGGAGGTAQPPAGRIDTTRPPRGSTPPPAGGKIDTTRPRRQGATVQPPAGRIDTTGPPRRAQAAPPQAPQSPPPGGGTVLVRGQRIPLPVEGFTLKYSDAGRPAGVDLNCFVFCLGADGRTRGDEDLVFFNHDTSADGAIHISQAGKLPQLSVELARAAAGTQRYVISLCLYEPPQGVTLHSLRSPQLTLESGGQVLYTLPLEGLNRELIVNVLELYRYRDTWRLSFVGAGYEAGLARLCNDYGIQVQ